MRLACQLSQCFKTLRILRSPPETRTPLDTPYMFLENGTQTEKCSLTPFLRKYKTAATSILYGDENCSGFIMAQTNPQLVWQFSEPNAGYG